MLQGERDQTDEWSGFVNGDVRREQTPHARAYAPRMGMTPEYALAYTFLPNLLKLKGPATVMSAFERKDLVFFDPLWAQAHVTHNPFVLTETRNEYRIATMNLPPPKNVGEAYMAGIVLKSNDPVFLRYFTLEHDYVLKKNADRTVLCEREGQKHSRIGDGPELTGNHEADARAFIESFMGLIIPTKVTRR
jgi:hypothetical protein